MSLGCIICDGLGQAEWHLNFPINLPSLRQVIDKRTPITVKTESRVVPCPHCFPERHDAAIQEWKLDFLEPEVEKWQNSPPRAARG